MNNIRSLVADDHDEFRKEFVSMLRVIEGIEVVGEARDGFEAVMLCELVRPDAVFLDISMKGMGGLEAARRIKAASPTTSVFFVTIHDEQMYKVLGSLIGVDGFIQKHDLKAGLRSMIKDMQLRFRQTDEEPSPDKIMPPANPSSTRSFPPSSH